MSATSNWARYCAAILLITIVGALSFGQAARSEQSLRSDELIPIERNGKWGYADKNGNVKIKPQFSLANRFSDGLALVYTEGVHLHDPVVTDFVKMGYIDVNGHWVIQSRFEYFFYDNFSEGLVPFRQRSNKWGYMDTSGKVVITPRFQWAGSFSNGAAPVLLDNKCTHVDKSGKVTDQSPSVLPRRKHEQGRGGNFTGNPNPLPCT